MSLFEFIPFINGGLFECLDKNKTSDGVEHAYFHDGFSRNDTIVSGHFTKRAFIPNKLFFDPENGIISIFRRYNFTVEENSPSEQLVALDPELLGKVFENLLGVYNPETHETARSASGSFYTPRTIVNFMIDRSLEAYLGNSEDVKALFEDDFEYDDSKKSFYDNVIKKLKNIKVLDPACGSGAFPMGMLNRIVEILQNLHAEGSKYDLKLAIMENCIFGGDIQTIAAQITKLRFFISLVCDCEKNDNPDDNFGIPNLPNLETHFVTCNSLISLKKPQQYSLFEQDVIALKDKLKQVRHEHFMAKTVYQKTKLRNRDKELRDELALMLKSDNVIASEDATQMAAWNPYDQNAKSPFFDAEWMFGIKDGFDIVIGNPPYKQIRKNIYSSQTFPYSEGKDVGKQNLYKLFVEHSYNQAKKDTGIACMIVQSSLMCDLSSKHTRELILKKTKLDYVIEFPKTAPTPEGQVFESVCQGTCIYLFRKNEPKDHTFILSVNNDCTTLKTMQEEQITQNALIEFYPEDYAIPLLRPSEFTILKNIKESSTLFSTYYEDALQGDLNLTSDSRYFNETQGTIKLIRGRHVKDFYIQYEVDEFVNETFKPNLLVFNQKHRFLVCQQITGMVDRKRLHFALTNPLNKFILGNSLNKILLYDENLNYYMLGLLNSYLLDWTFRKTSSNNHVNCYEIGQLPIIIADNIKPIENVVKNIITAKEEDSNADISDLEKDLNNEVFKLYGIKGKDRELIEKNYV